MALLLFIGCIPAANWMIGHVGLVCPPGGPCLVPLAPGLMVPSGALVIGAALVLRDMVQRQLGWQAAIAAIACGAALSAAVAPPSLVIASAAAFLLSELADMAVFSPLQKRQMVVAVLLSSLAGAVADSAIFLQLAVGSLDYLPQQVAGKLLASTLAAPVILWRRT